MTKAVQIKTGLTGAEKKLAKHLGGVHAVKADNGEWFAETIKPSYSRYDGYSRYAFLNASGATPVKAAQSLLRKVQLAANNETPFMVSDKKVEGLDGIEEETVLEAAGFQQRIMPKKIIAIRP